MIHNVNEKYIEFLSETVNYDGKERQRVRYINQWIDNKKSRTKHSEFKDIFDTPNKVFIWSDTHFGHRNVIRFCDRPYADVEEMNQTLIDNHNNVVSPDDICIWGGDIGFMGDSECNNIIKKCNGYKILIIGNHDFKKKKLRNLHAFDEIHLTYTLSYNGIDMVISHYPMGNLPKDVINIHGHVHNKVLDSCQHVNVCADYIDYRPMLFDDVLLIGQSRHAEIIG